MPKLRSRSGFVTSSKSGSLFKRRLSPCSGIDQLKVSALLRGRLEGFSCDGLFRFLNALDRDIEIVIRPAKKRSNAPRIRVVSVA
jgi:hypothetical protein